MTSLSLSFFFSCHIIASLTEKHGLFFSSSLHYHSLRLLSQYHGLYFDTNTKLNVLKFDNTRIPQKIRKTIGPCVTALDLDGFAGTFTAVLSTGSDRLGSGSRRGGVFDAAAMFSAGRFCSCFFADCCGPLLRARL